MDGRLSRGIPLLIRLLTIIQLEGLGFTQLPAHLGGEG